MANIPFLVDATVVQQDPDGYRLYVSIDQFGGQMPFLPVDVLTHGPRDAQRGNWPALPAPGTRGLVAFTRGDDRTGRWIGATSPSLQDSSASSPGNGNSDYRADYAGGWELSGADGTYARYFQDGTALLLGSAMPAPTRHVVAPGGARQRSPFTAAQRNPSPPAAMPLSLSLGSGASVAVTNNGAVTVTAPAGQSVTLQVTGGGSVVVGADGTVQLTSPSSVGINAPVATTSGVLTVGVGATGTFTSASGNTVTVRDGIVTNIY
jgi:hypothetical protein